MCLIVVKTLQLALIINRSFNVIINFSSVVYSGFYPRTVKNQRLENLVYIILPPKCVYIIPPPKCVYIILPSKHEALRSNTK